MKAARNAWTMVPGEGDTIMVRKVINGRGHLTIEIARLLADGQWSFDEVMVPGRTMPTFRGYAVHDELEDVLRSNEV